MNMYKHKWNFTLNYMAHGHRCVSNTTTTLNDLTSNTSVLQRGHAVTTGPFQRINTGLDFFMDPQNTFSLAGNIGFGHQSVHRYPDDQLYGCQWAGGFQQHPNVL